MRHRERALGGSLPPPPRPVRSAANNCGANAYHFGEWTTLPARTKPPMPRSVKIGPHKWVVDERKDLGDSDEFLYGRTRTRQTVIEIERDQSESNKRDTLLHELLHACISQLPYNLAYDEEETIVRGLTPFLLSVIRDNPKLLEFLTAEA